MIKISEYNYLKVSRIVDFGIYLKEWEEEGQEEVLMPGKWVPEGTKVDDQLRVFVYTDSEDRPIATTMEPLATLGEIAVMEVKSLTPFGAFLDWGLEKDLLLPRSEQIGPVAPGDKVVAKVCLDYKTNRMMASSKLNAFLETASDAFTPGQEVALLVYHKSPLAFQVMVDDEYAGLLYHNQVHEILQVGDRRRGFVSKLREDGKLDVSLKPFGRQGLKSDRDKVLEALQRHQGVLPLGDKSDAQDISRLLNMSKKSFKRALGVLYKERIVSLAQEETRLINSEA